MKNIQIIILFLIGISFTAQAQFNPFAESFSFNEGATILSLGIGIKHDIQYGDYPTETKIPPLTLHLEKQVFNNFGLGLTLGVQIDKVPVYDYQYRYYGGGLRLTYHPYLFDNLDVYGGGTATYRRVELTNLEDTVKNTSIDASWIAGVRYYFSESMGVFGEAGNDMLSHFRVGISFYL